MLYPGCIIDTMPYIYIAFAFFILTRVPFLLGRSSFSRIEPLQGPLAESLPESLKAAFANIEQLHICHSLVSWADVSERCGMTTALTHTSPSYLQVRYFSSAFPVLRVLDLAGNPLLGDCTTGRDSTAEKELGGLESLDLTDCGLDHWEDVMAILTQTPE